MIFLKIANECGVASLSSFYCGKQSAKKIRENILNRKLRESGGRKERNFGQTRRESSMI